MGVVVAVARTGISHGVAMLINVMSIMISIAAVAARDACCCHHYQHTGGELVDYHVGVPWRSLSGDHKTTKWHMSMWTSSAKRGRGLPT
jgi:hypothetical protein